MNNVRLLAKIVLLSLMLLLLVSGGTKASGCCAKDCLDAYDTMVKSGVPEDDAYAWYDGCVNDCEAHGDPTTCPKDNLVY